MNLFHELSSMFACMMWAGSALCFLAYGLTPEDPSNVNYNVYNIVIPWNCACSCGFSDWCYGLLLELEVRGIDGGI